MQAFGCPLGSEAMQRRRYLRATGGCFGVVALYGCAEILSTGDQDPDYPGRSLGVENAGDTPVRVAVNTKLDQYAASLDANVAGGEVIVRREFVTAEQGEIVTLVAQLGETGDRLRFQFLPAGGGDESPPEVAHLTVENAVEASATWAATSGT